jgi:hypothetical protein
MFFCYLDMRRGREKSVPPPQTAHDGRTKSGPGRGQRKKINRGHDFYVFLNLENSLDEIFGKVKSENIKIAF